MRELLGSRTTPTPASPSTSTSTACAPAIGAMAASLGGLDALVFTGGVGENSARVRELACEGLAYLGVPDGVAVLVIAAREDIEIARQTRALLG